MSRITLYLDAATQALVDRTAHADGLSTSVGWPTLVGGFKSEAQHTAHEWPQECLEAAGRFADFPLREDTAAGPDVDMPGLSNLLPRGVRCVKRLLARLD